MEVSSDRTREYQHNKHSNESGHIKKSPSEGSQTLK